MKKSIIALGVFASCAKADVVIGTLAAITGPVADMVPPIIESAQMAVDQINEQGGILEGQTLVLETSDSGCNPQVAIDAANTLITEKKVVAIVGPNCSGATISATSAVTIPAGIAVITPSATSARLTSLEDNDTVFRTTLADDYQAEVMAHSLINDDVNRAAISYIDDDYGRGLAETFQHVFEENGGRVVASSAHQEGEESYKSDLEELAKKEAEALVILDYADGSGMTILSESLENNLFKRFVASDGMKSEALIETIGADKLTQFMVTAPLLDQTDATVAFSHAFTERGYSENNLFAANSYDATFIIALAIEQAGSTDYKEISAAIRDVASAPGKKILPGQWSEALAAIKSGQGVDYWGATGENEFDVAGNVHGKIGLFKVEGNTYSQLKILD